jgi:putative ABC transport system ATP-binding protein
MRTPPITTHALDHYFGVGDARKQALFDINLEIARGSLTILMGPSGSGKTTLLTLIGCLREVKDGQVLVLGHELNGASEALLVSLRRRLGFIFQAHNLHESLTATQNVLMGLQVHGGGNPVKQRKAAHHILDLLGLADRRAALDKDSGQTVVKMLKSLGTARNTTTVMVTHDPRILEMADRIITLEDGRIISDEVQ